MENIEVLNKHTGTFKLMGQGILKSSLYNKLFPNKPDRITKNILIRSQRKNTASAANFQQINDRKTITHVKSRITIYNGLWTIIVP